MSKVPSKKIERLTDNPNETNENKISYTQKFARVFARSSGKGKGSSHYIEAPAKFANSTICVVLLNYLIQTETDDLDGNYVKLRMVSRIFSWISEHFKDARNLPGDIIERYHRYFNSQGLVEASVCQYIAQLRKAIVWSLKAMFLDDDYRLQREELQKIYSYIPSVPNNRKRGRLSLSQVTTGIITDELVLVRSVLRFCCAFLSIMNKYRNLLRSNECVERKLQKLLSDCGENFGELKWTCSGGHYKRDYREMAAAILSSEECTLKELLLANRTDLIQAQCDSGEKLSREQADVYIQSGLTVGGGLEFSRVIWPAPLLFENIDYLFLIKHTPAEEICFSWLLASDRVQQAGINELLLTDIVFTPSSVSVEYLKRRSAEHEKESPYHPKGSLRFNAYEDYVALRSSFLERFPQQHRNKLFDVEEPGSLQVLESGFFRPLILASLPHTWLHREMHNTNKEIAPFAKIIENVSIHNQELRIKRVAAMRGDSIACDRKRQSITVNTIAQSRAILDEDMVRHSNEKFEDLADETFDRYSQEVVGAASTAHTPLVKERFYYHANQTKYRFEKRAFFASLVGEMMVADARKIKQLCDQNDYLTVEQIKVFLGWQLGAPSHSDIEDFNSILKALQDKGWSITPFGQLENDGSVIVIISPVEAAMLLSYRDECQRQLEQLSIGEELRASALAMQISYTNAVLDRFDKKTVNEGLELMDRFPAPIIR